MGRSNFTNMDKFHKLLLNNNLTYNEIGINHLRIYCNNKKIFDYYPLRRILFDYKEWHYLDKCMSDFYLQQLQSLITELKFENQ